MLGKHISESVSCLPFGRKPRRFHLQKNIYLHIYLIAPGSLLRSKTSRRPSRHFSFSGAFRSGKLLGTTFHLTHLLNTPSINWPVETPPHNWLVLFWRCWDEILEDGKENLTVKWFCAPSGLTSAARHATVAFPLTYEKKSALRCKRRIKTPCIQSWLLSSAAFQKAKKSTAS